MAAGAAVQHLDAGQQFGKGVGLGQIIVAARPEPGDAVVDRAKRRKDEHGCGVAARAQPGDQRQAVAARQHAVDDQHVVVAAVGKREAAVAVGRHMRGVAGLGEGLFEIFRSFAIVFDDKNLHREPYTRNPGQAETAKAWVPRWSGKDAAAGDGTCCRKNRRWYRQARRLCRDPALPAR